MTFETIITTTRRELIQAFAALDSWFDRDDLLHDQLSSSKWNTIQLLEHVMRMNQHLVTLIDKTIRNVELYQNQLADVLLSEYDSDVHTEEDTEESNVKEPLHINYSKNEICATLRWQLYTCLLRLDEFRKLSEGNNSMNENPHNGMIFYYIYFLVEQVKRHIALLEKSNKKYEEQLL